LYWLDKGSVREREEARIQLSFFKDLSQLKNQMKGKLRKKRMKILQNSEMKPYIDERRKVE